MGTQLNLVRNRQFWAGVGLTLIATILVALGIPNLLRSRAASNTWNRMSSVSMLVEERADMAGGGGGGDRAQAMGYGESADSDEVRKMVRNASLRLIVNRPKEASDTIRQLAEQAGGFVVAADLSGALSAGALKHGARVRVPARVTAILQRGNDVEIQLENESVLASQVVVAAGSWTSQIRFEGMPAVPVHPVRGQLLHLGWDAAPLNRILWSDRCYLVPSAPGSILVGATVEDAGFDERTTVAGVRDLLEASCDLVPLLWRGAFLGVRVGLRPATPDEMPIIGRSRQLPGLVFATGHFRNGVLLAPVTARLVADLIIDNHEDPLLAGMSPQRFGEQ